MTQLSIQPPHIRRFVTVPYIQEFTSLHPPQSTSPTNLASRSTESSEPTPRPSERPANPSSLCGLPDCTRPHLNPRQRHRLVRRQVRNPTLFRQLLLLNFGHRVSPEPPATVIPALRLSPQTRRYGVVGPPSDPWKHNRRVRFRAGTWTLRACARWL